MYVAKGLTGTVQSAAHTLCAYPLVINHHKQCTKDYAMTATVDTSTGVCYEEIYLQDSLGPDEWTQPRTDEQR